MIDLHIHSTFSIDGSGSPEEIMQHAAQKGIRAISLAEHTSIKSLQPAQNAAKLLGIEYINGVETAGALEVNGMEAKIHIAAYFFDDNPSGISQLSDRQERVRELQADAFLDGLERMDIPLTRMEIENRYPGRYSSWAIRRILREDGYAKDKPEVKVLQEQAIEASSEYHPEYQCEEVLSVEDVLSMLKQDRATTFMAHPFWLTKASRGGWNENDVWKQIEAMLELGVDGIEAHNTGNDAGYAEIILDFCRQENIPASGGSDSHGLSLIGERDISYDLLQSMKNHAAGKAPWT